MNVHFAQQRPRAAMSARDLGREAFWSPNHPINAAYRRAYGTGAVSLVKLIEFAEELPPEILANYAEQAGAIAQAMGWRA